MDFRILKKGKALAIVLALMPMTAAAERINYKTANLECQFTHDCSGAQVNQHTASPRDLSKCRPVSEIVRWNNAAGTLTWQGKELLIVNKRQRRVGLTIQTLDTSEAIRFSTGRSSASLLVSTPDGRVTHFYPGICAEVQ